MNNSSTQLVDGRFEMAIEHLSYTYPLFEEALRRMAFVPVDGLKTFAVRAHGCQYQLLYDPDFVVELKSLELSYLLMHEVCHIAFGHFQRLIDNSEYQLMYNIAMDLSINTRLGINSVPPFSSHMSRLICPNHFGFPEMLSTEQYLRLLSQDGVINFLLLWDRLLDQYPLLKQTYEHIETAHHFEPGPQIDTEYIEIIEAINEKRDKSFGRGDYLTSQILEFKKDKEWNWGRILQKSMQMQMQQQFLCSWTRPHRRHGWPYPGQRIKTDINRVQPKLLIGVDTSGSMSDRQIQNMLGQIEHIAKVCPIDLCCFDTRIGDIYPWRKGQNTFHVTLRGGTDPNSLFEYAVQKRYQWVMVMSDGGFSPPPKPPSIDVIWVIDESMGTEYPFSAVYGTILQIATKKIIRC